MRNEPIFKMKRIFIMSLAAAVCSCEDRAEIIGRKELNFLELGGKICDHLNDRLPSVVGTRRIAIEAGSRLKEDGIAKIRIQVPGVISKEETDLVFREIERFDLDQADITLVVIFFQEDGSPGDQNDYRLHFAHFSPSLVDGQLKFRHQEQNKKIK